MSTSLKTLQNQFSQAARGTAIQNDLTFDEKKLTIYRELLLNNLNEIVRPCFPVLLSFLPEETWWEILRDFLKHHQALTPLFHELPKCLVDYLQEHPIPRYPFAAELAHYEWVELEVELCDAQEQIIEKTPNQINLLEQLWQLAPTARLLEYHYEVDKISKNYLPKATVPTYLIVYRKNDKVEFLKINVLSYQLLTVLFQDTLSTQEIIHTLCQTNPQLHEASLLPACMQLLSMLYDEQIVQTKVGGT